MPGTRRGVEKKQSSRTNKRRKPFRRLLGQLFFAITLVVLPFFILIRTAIFLNVYEAWNGWLALGGAAFTTVVLLSLVFIIIFRKVKNKTLVYRMGTLGISALVVGFIVYGLVFLNSVNAKTEAVREVYGSLHPILRVAVASTTLAEKELVITDIRRTPDDYSAMGLTPRQSSLHYQQYNGFVHAVDLRTIGHSEFRNFLLEIGLKVMGFQTIRHVGTADHLHVALPTGN